MSTRNRGLSNWNFASPFQEVEVSIDDIHIFLEHRYLEEANGIVDRVSHEHGRYYRRDRNANNLPTTFCLSRLDRDTLRTDVTELQCVIIFHCLCASYSVAPYAINAERDAFLHMPMDAKRFDEVWSAFSCTERRRTGTTHTGKTWRMRPTEGCSFVTGFEAEIARVDRPLFYVEGATTFSSDEYLHRLSSRSVSQHTGLKQQNNPKKGLGIINNAICPALSSALIVTHHSRPGGKFIDI